MSTTTITDISANDWNALKAMSHAQHGTVHDGDEEGTFTTDTPGMGKTVVGYSYDASAQTAEFTLLEAPAGVPAEVVWFALGGSVAHASGAAQRSHC